MIDLHPKYQVDERGNRFVVLTEEEFENLLALAQRRTLLKEREATKHPVGSLDNEQDSPANTKP